MIKKDFQNFKKILEQKKSNLEKALARFSEKDKNLKDDYDTKYTDFGNEVFDNTAEAQEVSNYDANLSLEANLELQLRNVNEALEKIKKGTYGKCEECSREIDIKRLEAEPTARLCFACSKKDK